MNVVSGYWAVSPKKSLSITGKRYAVKNERSDCPTRPKRCDETGLPGSSRDGLIGTINLPAALVAGD
jgi:hypothetical protein